MKGRRECAADICAKSGKIAPKMKSASGPGSSDCRAWPLRLAHHFVFWCAPKQLLLRSILSFGAHQSNFCCAPFCPLVRTRATFDAHQSNFCCAPEVMSVNPRRLSGRTAVSRPMPPDRCLPSEGTAPRGC